MSAGGKGSVARPFDVAFEQYAANFDLIFGKRKNVLQQETQNADRNPETTPPAQVGGEVVGDSESPAERIAAPQAE